MADFRIPPLVGEQKEMLIAFLDQQRQAVYWKLQGLTEDQLRDPHPVTGFSLLGLLKHLAYAEQQWFHHRLAGEVASDDPNSHTAWHPDADESFENLAQTYETHWQHSNDIARQLDLDQTTRYASPNYGTVSLQWVLLHMIEETARHLGHADIIRQSIDGATGVNPAYEEARRRASKS